MTNKTHVEASRTTGVSPPGLNVVADQYAAALCDGFVLIGNRFVVYTSVIALCSAEVRVRSITSDGRNAAIH
jgi:hypothetical protein